MNKNAHLEAIADQVRDLDISPLYEFRLENNYQPVIGEGNLDADIVFIGEAPGKNEALSGSAGWPILVWPDKRTGDERYYGSVEIKI